ncbi:hypothetical protein PSQ40_04770 [Curvibacter sp. HBC61]|uniref:WYL domain-containing protein n=1 Tax=Curvibacter cyanobacteriorum TaxID=3026422 RepID=A0ABT5MYN2_9BURK|nr:hypothetical protein [Curvibacter sp. HBC61]MDD0837878.1 hypothetical protein [Curvibacter sp. HBC61]
MKKWFFAALALGAEVAVAGYGGMGKEWTGDSTQSGDIRDLVLGAIGIAAVYFIWKSFGANRDAKDGRRPMTSLPEAMPVSKPIQPAGIDWNLVSIQISNYIKQANREDRPDIYEPHARFIVNREGRVSFACDKRATASFLGANDLACYSISEDQDAFFQWTNGHAVGGSMFVQATDDFARLISAKLCERVNVDQRS